MKYANSSSLSPILIAQGTSFVLERYFSNAIPQADTPSAHKYLSDHTLSYINKAEKGFRQIISKKTKKVPLHLKQVFSHAKPVSKTPNVQNNEAFLFALVVFSLLPTLSTSSAAPGFPAASILTLPENTKEFLERILELKREIVEIITGKTSAYTPLVLDHALARTFLFFQVGSDISFRYEAIQEEMEERAKEALQLILNNKNTY